MSGPSMLDAALWYAEHGIKIFALNGITNGVCSCGGHCASPGKHPLTPNGWKDATCDAATIKGWWQRTPAANIGMPTAGMLVVDIDPRNGGEEAWEDIRGTYEPTAEQLTGGGGRHIIFRQDTCGKLSKRLAAGIDLKGAGGYIVLAPSMHASGRRYEFDGEDGQTALLHLAPAPTWLLRRMASPPNGSAQHRNGTTKSPIIPKGEQHNTLVSIAGTMRRRGMDADEIEAALQVTNRKRLQEPAPPEHIRRIAESVAKYEPAVQPAEADLLLQLFNDHGNSERLVALHGVNLRFCYAWRRWVVWEGRKWTSDNEGRAVKLAKETMLAFIQQAVRSGNKAAENFAKASLDERRIRNMLSSAECELPISMEEFDRNPHLLNFENGTLDLSTGELREHRRGDYITKIVRHDYDEHAVCPLWMKFLARIMGAHSGASESALVRSERLVHHLQGIFGYALTGLTSEKVVFLFYGSGNNGKTTLLTVVRDLVEGYAGTLQIDSLMVRQESNNASADLADLRGARFVMTSETEEGQRLAEGKLKRITQGMGRIKAARKYENPIEFAETHKLFMDCNHKPVVRGVDNAIWNRLHCIPFLEVIGPNEVDRNLRTKLHAEAEGILVWAVQGARRWYAEGLGRPPEVEEAVADYRSEMDQLGRFLSEVCILLPTETSRARQLYNEYKKWAEEGGESAVSEARFGTRMRESGYAKKVTETGMVYQGLGVRHG